VSLLPALLNDDTGLTSRQVAKARSVQASTELRLFGYTLEAHTLAEMDRLDSQAAGDASRAALDEEIGLLEHGLARAGGSAAVTELAARRVELLAAINDRRITRRFGG
jgi:hypothetical protein